jgi:P3 major capsid protein
MAASPPMAQGTTAAQTNAMKAQNAINTNAAIRGAILNNSISVTQSIFNQTVAAPGQTNNVFQVPFRAVGLVKGFIVKVNATFSEIGDDDTATPTPWNIANLLSNVTLYDLDNYQRINTNGIQLNMLGTSKEGFNHGAALLLAAFDCPIEYGNNFDCLTLVAPTADATGSAQMYYWVPCSYSATDLRGAIFAGVVNATAYLQLTVNPRPFVATGGDATLAIFTGTEATPTTISSVTIQVYQVYLDQLPRYTSGPQAGAPILPPIDIATQYRLNQTNLQGVTVGQDFPVPFSNFQQFLTLGLLYDQAGAAFGGTDINYFALAAANTYLPFKYDPITASWLSRHKIKTDWPVGAYMFDFRQQPLSTNQTGNMQLLLNAISAAANSTVLPMFESFALVNTVLGAASLPAS